MKRLSLLPGSFIVAFTATTRLCVAQAGIFGNNADEAFYPMTLWLPDGEVIDTSKHSYKVTFPAG